MARRMRPKEWGLGVAATITLIITISVIVAALIFGLLYLALALLTYFFSRSEIPW